MHTEDLTATTSPGASAVVPVVVDPAGTPLDRKLTMGNAAPWALLGENAVATSQTTTSSSYADLSTVGPSVTFVVPAGETWDVIARWHVAAGAGADTSGTAWCQAVLDGSAPANDDYAAQMDTNNTVTVGSYKRFTGLTAGSHTIKLQYKVSGSITGAFGRRRLTVERTAWA